MPKSSETFEDGLAIGLLLSRRHGRHPDRVTYTDSDPSYIPPTPVAGETFDTYKEDWLDNGTVIFTQKYGVGVLNKGTATEQVTRLIFPDLTYVSLINF